MQPLLLSYLTISLFFVSPFFTCFSYLLPCLPLFLLSHVNFIFIYFLSFLHSALLPFPTLQVYTIIFSVARSEWLALNAKEPRHQFIPGSCLPPGGAVDHCLCPDVRLAHKAPLLFRQTRVRCISCCL